MRYSIKTAGIHVLAAFVGAFASCSPENTADEAPYLYFGEEVEMLSFGQEGGKHTFEMYSNQGPWVVEPEYRGDEAWIDIWPNEGNNDGRFTLTVSENRNAETRISNMNVVIGSTVVKSVRIQQIGSAPSILLDMGSDNTMVLQGGGEVTVKLISNALWKVVIPEDAGWITAGDHTGSSQTLVIASNPGAERKATVRFQVVGTGNESIYVDYTITQFDSVSDPMNGKQISISELYDICPDGGVIEENLWIEGTVINDISRMNMDPERMFIQDESGRGIRLDFESEAENYYEIGTRVKVHLYKREFRKDGDSGAMYFGGITSSAVFSVEEGEPMQPVDVTDIADLDRLENTLVRIKDVSFLFPWGTYMAVSPDQFWYNSQKKNTSSLAYCDGHDLCGQTVVSADGRSVRIMSTSTFLDRHARTMPSGSGDITGIVCRYVKAGVRENVLFIRSDEDNTVSSDPADCQFNTVVRFGPFSAESDLDRISASVGAGQMKTSVFESVGPTAGVQMNWGWYYLRKAPASVIVDPATGVQTEDPPVNSKDPIHVCVSTQKLWSASGSTINRTGADPSDDGQMKGEAWIFNIEDFSPVSGGDLYLNFTESSSQTGPMYYVIEWNEDENAPMDEFRKIADFTSPDLYSSSQCEHFRFRLPDEMKSLERFTIRFRVTKDWNAGNGMVNGKTTSATGIGIVGSTRIGIWSITENR